MKRVLFGSLALLVSLSAPSHAADMTIVPRAVYNWAGCYGGGNIGYSWGRAYTNTTTPSLFINAGNIIPSSTYSNSNSLDGVIGGGQVGCNWQPNNGHWVYGFETDIQWSGEKGSFETSNLTAYNLTNDIDVFTNIDPDTAIAWFGTVRGRLGYVFNNNWLVYATGGFAYGKVKYSGTVTETENIYTKGRGVLLATFTQVASFGSASKVNPGWTLGAGFEAPLGNNWSWGLEYLYLNLGKINLSAETAVGTYKTSTKFTDNIFRFRLSKRFWTF